MSAEEYYLSKKWGNPKWDRKIATNFCKSEMFDFAESYAREYHAKEMERVLREELDKVKLMPEYQVIQNPTDYDYRDVENARKVVNTTKWLLNYLKRTKTR